MITLAPELFIPEFTTPAIVTRYWQDGDAWDDQSTLSETITVPVIFDNAYLQIDLGQAGIQSLNPQIAIQTAIVPHAREGDLIQINGTTYQTQIPRPNGNGITLIDLISL
jgi:hypothetical protein